MLWPGVKAALMHCGTWTPLPHDMRNHPSATTMVPPARAAAAAGSSAMLEHQGAPAAGTIPGLPRGRGRACASASSSWTTSCARTPRARAAPSVLPGRGRACASASSSWNASKRSVTAKLRTCTEARNAAAMATASPAASAGAPGLPGSAAAAPQPLSAPRMHGLRRRSPLGLWRSLCAWACLCSLAGHAGHGQEDAMSESSDQWDLCISPSCLCARCH